MKDKVTQSFPVRNHVNSSWSMATKTVFSKKRKLNKVSLFLAIILLLSGAGLIYFSASSRWQLASPAPQQLQLEESINYPVKLYIPKISRVLDVTDGQVQDNRWTVSDSGVSYFTASARPGTLGNSVLYGHNKKEILGSLPKLSIGDPIFITTKGGEIIKYEVFDKKEIKPTQVEILNETEDSRLTIYTCSGFLDQSRFVVISKKVD